MIIIVVNVFVEHPTGIQTYPIIGSRSNVHDKEEEATFITKNVTPAVAVDSNSEYSNVRHPKNKCSKMPRRIDFDDSHRTDTGWPA
jgi:hypothetical protein